MYSEPWVIRCNACVLGRGGGGGVGSEEPKRVFFRVPFLGYSLVYTNLGSQITKPRQCSMTKQQV